MSKKIKFKTGKEKFIKEMLVIIISLFLSLTFVNSVFAEDTSSWPAYNVCCEKTKNGAWCQNSKEGDCVENYRKTPTSCDATSFCKLGCCVDSSEGLCMKNTPQKVCENSAGTWLDDSECDVAQCQLGCCLIGDQASFVTLTRCKRISRIYGLETNFKKEITNEAECILKAYAEEKGACIFEVEGEKNCIFTTRQECKNSNKGGNITGETEFFKDYLCSADELATNCGPTQETICIEGKDEVYFKDSCGNPANIYDASRIYSKDASYWQRIVPKSSSCGYEKGNLNSKTCGNCDYLKGSLCGKGSATYGNYVCKDLNCYNTKNGKSYKNGESWCEYMGEQGNGLDSVGSRHFRHVCIHGEEITEPCDDFRNEVCIEQESGSSKFLEAACKINRWTDCISQIKEDDCLNEDKRDCFWVSGVHYSGSSQTSTQQSTSAGTSGSGNIGVLKGGNICLPNNPPGLEFWNEGNAKSVCSLGYSRQIVNFTAGISGTRKCKDNCEVLNPSWVNTMNQVCLSLGDCGAYVNFAGKYTDDGIVWKQNGKLKNIQTGILEDVEESSGSATTNVTGFNANTAGTIVQGVNTVNQATQSTQTSGTGGTTVVD